MPPKHDPTAKYDKLDQIEHILRRPEMYMGSIEDVETTMWTLNSEKGFKMTYKNVKLNQGLLKIFDEIVVNASDNIHRTPDSKPMTYIKVEITDAGKITVTNDGQGIPVMKSTKHSEYWVPDMIFGHLLTGENLSDAKADSVSAGRHGYGAKLTNVMSTQFSVTTRCDGEKFEKTWSGNMRKHGSVQTSKSKGTDFTEITFSPDYARFGCTNITKDMKLIFIRRCVDLAVAFPEVEVSFNGKVLPSKFSSYVSGFVPSEMSDQGIYTAELASGRSKKEQTNFGVFLDNVNQRRDISAVNGVVTHNSGTHVQYYLDQLSTAAEKSAKLFQESHPNTTVQTKKIINALTIVAFCRLHNPKFDSQSKVRLVSEHPFPKVDVNAVAEWLVNLPKYEEMFVKSIAEAMDKGNSDRGSKAKFKLPKLVDAVMAGQAKRGGPPCTLILTEGDSAKALAVSALSADMRQTFGVFPLRGKLLNARNELRKLAENEELKNLFLAVGLKAGEPDISDPTSLRYQRIMIMTDQDPDGSHIRGLLLNLFEVLWPKLAARLGFIDIFVTPLLKVTCEGKVIPFYNKAEYERWNENHKKQKNPKPFTVKYYKGLGTSTATEGKEYFADVAKHTLQLTDLDAGAKKHLKHVFHRDFADWRKEWVSSVSFTNEPALEGLKELKGIRQYPVVKFLDTEFIHFAVYDNMRTMPSVMDGLKIVNRKALWTMFNRKNDEIKVAQLTGLVSLKSGYHHGEASLSAALVKMAQDYVGANNIPLLRPIGQFGTRIMNGADSAAPRYIFTKLSDLARAVFPEEDDQILTPVIDDGVVLEPTYYAPVIPMVFANGSVGIGVGYATTILNHNPAELSSVVRRKLKGERGVNINLIRPDAVGFRGTSTAHVEKGAKATSSGAYTLHESTRSSIIVRIIELPLYWGIEAYRSHLDDMIKNGDIDTYDDFSTGTTVDLEVKMRTDRASELMKEGNFEKKFSLVCNHAENLCTISSRNIIQAHGTDKAPIFEEFYSRRLDLYKKRREHQLVEVTKQIKRAEGLIQFSEDLKAKRLNLVTMDMEQLQQFFKSNKYPVDPDTDDYEYLTNRQLTSVLKTNYDKLKDKKEELLTRKKFLTNATPQLLWEIDLDKFDKVFTQYASTQRSLLDKELAARKVPPVFKMDKLRLAEPPKTALLTAGDATPSADKGKDKPSEATGGRKGSAAAPATPSKPAPPKLKGRGSTPAVDLSVLPKAGAALAAAAVRTFIGRLLL